MIPLKTVPTKVPCVVSPEAAVDALRSGAAVIADVRWYADGRAARAEYSRSHVSGARFVDVERDLSTLHNHDPAAGRHPFPDPEDFAASMSRLGIGDDTWVIAYDDTGGMTAARLVVMLRMLGKRASLLDGGLAVWSSLHPDLVDSGEPDRVPKARFDAQPWPARALVTEDEMVDIVRHGALSRGTVILDARAAERFEGIAPSGPETLDPRAGHIPGACNAPWNAVVSPDSRRLRDTAQLRKHYEQLGVGDARMVVASCGSGISACLNVLAIEHAGFPTPRLFVPSWSGWSSDPDKPIATGRVRIHRWRLRRAARAQDMVVVRDLRQARRHRRLADLEWFEALYRVYLAAFVFGGGAMFISGFVPDDEVSARTAADVWRSGPGWLGLAAVVAIAIGVRSGSRGGPLAIESADVHHLLLAPVDRRRALLRPAVQALRTATFSTTLIGALTGYLAARRLPGTAPQWVLWGSVWGSVAGALYIGSALVSHGMRLPRWASSTLAIGLVTWQLLSALPASTGIALDIQGFADAHGDLALGAHGVPVRAVIPIAIACALAGIGLTLVGRQSIDALVRRSSLVSQLRFAVTVQDLRTVTLLRRRLSEERSRTRPWIDLRRHTRLHSSGLGAEWRRAWSGLLRFPFNRLVRIVMLCIVAGLSMAAAHEGTTPAIVIAGMSLFMVALEILEPLAQEIDQSDRTFSYPHPRGNIHLRLTSPVLMIVPVLAGLVIAVMVIVEPGTWLIAIIGSISAVFAACAGAAVNIVAGSPDPATTVIRQNTMPPEVAGTVSIIKSLWPLALAVAGCLPVVMASIASDDGSAPEAAAVRTAIAVLLGVGLIAAWIRLRDDIRRSLDRAISESRGSLQKGRP